MVASCKIHYVKIPSALCAARGVCLIAGIVCSLPLDPPTQTEIRYQRKGYEHTPRAAHKAE